MAVGNQGPRKNSNSHIDASHSRQPLVKGERLVRYEVNAVMDLLGMPLGLHACKDAPNRFLNVSQLTLRNYPEPGSLWPTLPLLGVSKQLLPLGGQGGGV